MSTPKHFLPYRKYYILGLFVLLGLIPVNYLPLFDLLLLYLYMKMLYHYNFLLLNYFHNHYLLFVKMLLLYPMHNYLLILFWLYILALLQNLLLKKLLVFSLHNCMELVLSLLLLFLLHHLNRLIFLLLYSPYLRLHIFLYKTLYMCLHFFFIVWHCFCKIIVI